MEALYKLLLRVKPVLEVSPVYSSSLEVNLVRRNRISSRVGHPGCGFWFVEMSVEPLADVLVTLLRGSRQRALLVLLICA